MARRRKRFGEIRRSAAKVRRYLFRTQTSPAWETSNIFLAAKKGSIHFEVVRTYEKGGAFKARACMLSRAAWLRMYRTPQGPSTLAYKRQRGGVEGGRCAIAQGPTPTRAVKRATISLMRKIR